MTDIKLDRREILGLLRPHIPTLPADISSDDLHAFLDVQTGLTTAFDEANGSAFDKWRKALAAQGYPVWGYSPDRTTAMQDRAIELKALEAARVAALPKLLEELAKSAPGTPLTTP
jgi:hypothetical protein